MMWQKKAHHPKGDVKEYHILEPLGVTLRPSECGASYPKDKVVKPVYTEDHHFVLKRRQGDDSGFLPLSFVLQDSEVALIYGGSESVEFFNSVDQADISIVKAVDDNLSNRYCTVEVRRTQVTAMARRAGKRGGSRMRMSKVTKRRAYARRRKPAKRQYRKRKRDDDSEIEAAITRVRDYKGKKIKPDNSDADTDAGTSLATSLQELSDETSAGLASCPSDSTPGKKDSKRDERGKNKRKSRKKDNEIREVSGDSKTTTERTPTRKLSKNHSSKRRRFSQKAEEQTQMTKGSDSGKPSVSAGSGNMKKNNNAQDGNDPPKGEPKDAKGEPCNDKAAPKDVVAEEHHEEESSSSSG